MPCACLPRSPHKALRLALHGAHGNVLKAGIDTSSGYDLVRDLVVSSEHAERTAKNESNAPVNPCLQEQFAAEMLPAGDSECLEQLLHELAAD